jgi:hypothetical protein
MTDKTEWLDWACLGQTGVTHWTSEWLGQLSGLRRSSSFFLRFLSCHSQKKKKVPPDGETTEPPDQQARRALARA